MNTGLHAHVVVQMEDFSLDASVAIAPGTTAALLGPNGAGKSTVVGALAGLVPLTAGRIVLGSRTLDDPRQGVFVPPGGGSAGVVFQDYVLFPHLSVVENVAFGPRSRGRGRDAARRSAEAWVQRLGLEELAARRPGDLSGGQAQRVALARALADDPELLLLDEPLAALDVTTRVRLRHTLSDHLDEFAGPRLFITHDPTEAFLLADVIHVLEEGRITQVGAADDIRLQPRTPYVADLAGANLFRGEAHAGTVVIDGHSIQIADTSVRGPVLVTIHARAVALYPGQPEGSPRNAWPTRITRIEHLGDRVRVLVEAPLRLTIEVTEEATQALHLAPGSEVWASVKATEIGVTANGDG